MAAPNWKTYDTNGDGKLTDAELTTWDNVVRAYRNYVDSNFENTYEADIAASESTSVSPYEDGSASDSFYGNWDFPVPDTEESTTTNWWADDSTAWWDVKDPAAFFGVKGNRTEEQVARVQQFRDEFKYDLDGAKPTLQLLNSWIDGDIPTSEFKNYVGTGTTPPSTDPALVGIVGYDGTAPAQGNNWYEDFLSSVDAGTNAQLAEDIGALIGAATGTAKDYEGNINPDAYDEDGDGVLTGEERRAYDFAVAVDEGTIMTFSGEGAPSSTGEFSDSDANVNAWSNDAWTTFWDRLSFASQQVLKNDLKAGELGADGQPFIDTYNANGMPIPFPRAYEMLQSLMNMFITVSGFEITPTAMEQARSMNAAARGELREKTQWIAQRVREGWTQEQARHLYYEWGGEGQEVNPNKTLSDTEIADIYQLYQAGEIPEGQYPATYAGDTSTITKTEVDWKRNKLLAAAQSPIAKASIGKLTDDQIRDRIATEQKEAAILEGLSDTQIYSPEFLENKRRLVKAGVDAIDAWTEPFEPEMQRNLKRLAYEGAINKLNDFADSIATTRDENGGWVSLDTKAKKMLNLASFGLSALGTTAQEMAGAISLIGETASDSILGRFGTAFVNLGASTETQDFADAANEVEARIGRATGFFDTAKAVFQDGVPVEYLLRMIAPEVGNEVILSRVFGGTTKGTKFKDADERFRDAILRTDRPTGGPEWLKDKLKTLGGIQPDELGDVAELVFATAGGSFDRSYETAIKSGMSEEEALDYAYGVMGKTVTGAFLVNRIAAGLTIDDMVENFFPGADNKKAREALEAIYNHPTIRAALSAGGEGATEGLEEAVATAITTTELVLIDDSIDVAGEVGQNAFFGTLFGSLVDVSMTAGFAIDSAAASVIAARNPEINSVLTTAREEIDAGTDLATVTRNMEETLNGIGLTNVASQTDILDSVNDAAFTTGAETERKFEELGYTATEEEIDEYIGKSNEADTLNNIDTYVDPRQVTVDEAKAELIAQGITDPSDAEIAAYVGQGDETFQSTKNTEIETYADPRVIDDAEARAALQAQGIANPKQEEIDQFTGQGDENFETNNIGKATDYANPLALSAAEIEDIAAKQGYTLAAGEAEALSGRVIPGQTEAEALASQENTFNNAAITAAELEAIAAAQGYTLTPEDRALIGNNPNAAQELLNASNRFNAGAITREEIETAARNAGIDPKDLTSSDYALVGTITSAVDADGNPVTAADLLAYQEGVFEGRVADATAAERKAAAEAAITAAVTAAGAPALSPTDLQRYVAMAIGGGLTIAEAVQAAEADIAAAAVTDDGVATNDGETVDGDDATDDGAVDPFVSYLNGLFERFGVDTNTWPEGNSIGSLQGPNGPIDANGDGIYSPDELIAAGLTEEMGFNPDLFKTPTDDAAATDDGATNDGADSGATTDSGGNQSVMDQVVAAITAAGVTLAQDKIDEIVADVVSGAVTNIDEAVADKVAEVAGNDTDSGTDNQLDDSTIEGDPDDYVKVKDFNREVGTLQDNIVKLITKLESEGATRDEALAAAIGVPAGQTGGPSGLYAELGKFATSDQAEAIKKVVDGIATELGTTADDVAAIKIKLDTLVTKDDISGLATKEDVTDAEGRLNTRIEELEAEGKTRLDAVDIALEELATDLGTTKKDITDQLTKFESDLALDIAELATKQDVLDSEKRIRDKQDEYVRQGMKADEALQAAINDVATELGVTKDVLTDQLAAFQTKLDADLSLLATKQQVNTLETELYLKIAEYEAQAISRDEATKLAIADLATDLETTEDNLMTQLGVTQDTLTDRINEVETNLENQFNSQIESTKELITETATETQKQIQTTANQSAARDFFDMVLGSEDLEGQEVTVSQSPLAQINYIYDFQDPLANQQQRGFFGAASPYGESLAAGKSRRPQTIANVMQGPLNLQGAPVGPMGMAAGGKVDYDFLNEISQIMSFGE